MSLCLSQVVQWLNQLLGRLSYPCQTGVALALSVYCLVVLREGMNEVKPWELSLKGRDRRTLVLWGRSVMLFAMLGIIVTIFDVKLWRAVVLLLGFGAVAWLWLKNRWVPFYQLITPYGPVPVQWVTVGQVTAKY